MALRTLKGEIMCEGVKYIRGKLYWICDNGLCYLTDDEFNNS
jgi:hypothetical protein